MDWLIRLFGNFYRALQAAVKTFKSFADDSVPATKPSLTRTGVDTVGSEEFVTNVTINIFNINQTMTENIFGPKVSGNITVMGNMIDSLKAVNDFRHANISLGGEDQERQNLAKALDDLRSVVTKLAERLPAKEAEQVSRDLKAITQEAVSEEPRKPWYELSGKGLIEAAKTVAEMATPVATAVTAVLSLLSGS